MSCITYTKQLLFSLFLYFGSVEMSYYSNPPLDPLLLDLSTNTGFVPFAGLLAEPLPDFRNPIVSKDTSSVVIVSSQISAYVAC
jgi:hypothetical protein